MWDSMWPLRLEFGTVGIGLVLGKSATKSNLITDRIQQIRDFVKGLWK